MPTDEKAAPEESIDDPEMRETISDTIALCDLKLKGNPDAVLEMTVELFEDDSVGGTVVFIGLPCKILSVNPKDQTGTIEVLASALKASLHRVFPQITKTEIALAADRLVVKPKKKK